LPFSASITSSASAPARVAASEVAAQAMPTHISVRATEDRVEDITARGSNPLGGPYRSAGGKGLSKPTADERQKRKAHGDTLMPATTVHGKRKRPKFGSLGRAVQLLRFHHNDRKSPIGSE